MNGIIFRCLRVKNILYVNWFMLQIDINERIRKKRKKFNEVKRCALKGIDLMKKGIPNK